MNFTQVLLAPAYVDVYGFAHILLHLDHRDVGEAVEYIVRGQ